MIDDLSLTALSLDGRTGPWGDWGYLLDGPGSLYAYINDNLLKRFPEIKGTFFYPLSRHGCQNTHAGYDVTYGKRDQSFKTFVERIAPVFELAFHGTTHGRFRDPTNPSFGNWQQEFEYLTEDDIPALAKQIREAEESLEVRLQGGKYPGCVSSAVSAHIVELLGFKWWSGSADMINRRHARNAHHYFGTGERVLNVPINIGGDVFNDVLHQTPGLFGGLRPLRRKLGKLRSEMYLQYLYEKGLPITVQEHHSCMRTDGKRQTPNLFDDIDSVSRIFSILRGADIWYATCTELAQYLESYDNSRIDIQADGQAVITYAGRWETMTLSCASEHRELVCEDTGETVKGRYKQGRWVYDRLSPGRYSTGGHAG
ncbi:MAG: hypothetical protein KKA42_15275 [candidate division Zixibacteria bacterium]|nr:hypothetical protein [candidate division Zixibacteria bacterium]